MSFYKSIAHVYDFIFPANLHQVDFVKKCIPEISEANLLDVGCGTGNLALALAEHCMNITGVDIDKKMLAIAQSKDRPANVHFANGNMLNLTEQFDSDLFDGLICFGNTLANLDGLNDMEVFLLQCKQLLKPGGKLLIQIVNYDRVLNEHINSLPTIENNIIKFERDYEYISRINRIDFISTLTDKLNGEVIHNKHQLYPLTEMELFKLLGKLGFEVLNRFGSFNGEPINMDSIPMIFEAGKNTV